MDKSTGLQAFDRYAQYVTVIDSAQIERNRVDQLDRTGLFDGKCLRPSVAMPACANRSEDDVAEV